MSETEFTSEFEDAIFDHNFSECAGNRFTGLNMTGLTKEDHRFMENLLQECYDCYEEREDNEKPDFETVCMRNLVKMIRDMHIADRTQVLTSDRFPCKEILFTIGTNYEADTAIDKFKDISENGRAAVVYSVIAGLQDSFDRFASFSRPDKASEAIAEIDNTLKLVKSIGLDGR